VKCLAFKDQMGEGGPSESRYKRNARKKEGGGDGGL